MKTLFLFILFISFSKVAISQIKKVKTIFISTQKDKATDLNKPQVYKLKKQTVNSDFDYSKLESIDASLGDTINTMRVMSVFDPVNGKYSYFQFIATFKGEAYNIPGPILIKAFHDILIVKTDSHNVILDAYQYTLEWSELPCQYDVFKSSVRGLILKHNMDISLLKLKRTSRLSNDEPYEEQGIIKLH